MAKELRPLLTHGIGVHHAGILPRYKQLVEELTLERKLRFVVSTETIAAGINLNMPDKEMISSTGTRVGVLPAVYHNLRAVKRGAYFPSDSE